MGLPPPIPMWQVEYQRLVAARRERFDILKAMLLEARLGTS